MVRWLLMIVSHLERGILNSLETSLSATQHTWCLSVCLFQDCVWDESCHLYPSQEVYCFFRFGASRAGLCWHSNLSRQRVSLRSQWCGRSMAATCQWRIQRNGWAMSVCGFVAPPFFFFFFKASNLKHNFREGSSGKRWSKYEEIVIIWVGVATGNQTRCD